MKIDLNTLLKNNKHENSLTKMIDNPVPDQVMRQMDADAEASRFEDYCNEQSKQLCEENDVHKVLIEDFQEWYHSYYCEHRDEVPVAVSAEDVDLINTWWDENGDDFDDYKSPFQDYEPTDHEMMSNFGTKWHDGL